MASKRIRVLVLASALAAACDGGDEGGPGGIASGDPRLDLAASVHAPASADAGATVTVLYEIQNAGTLASGWTAEVRFGPAATPWTSLTPIESLSSTEALAPGTSASGSVLVDLPAGLASGSYQVALRVNGGQDGHPENDVGAAVIAITGSGPGTCVDDAYEEDDLPGLARPLPRDVEIARNFCFDGNDWGSLVLGPGEQIGLRLVSEGPRVALAISTGDLPGPTIVGTESPGVPEAGRFTAPAAGTYHLYTHSLGLAYGPGRGYSLWILPPYPDPEAIAVYWEDQLNAPAVGGVADIRVDLRNNGFDMTDPVTVEFVLSADSVLDAGDRPIDRQPFPALAADEWRYEYLHVPIPPDVTPGDWYVIAVVDPDGALVEQVEENNVSPAASILLVTPECQPDSFEEDDRPADARPIDLGVWQAHNYCDDAFDWVSFEAVAGEDFTVDVRVQYGPQSMSLRVLGPSGALVAEADGLLTFTASEAGVHRVEVSTGGFGDWEDYEVIVTRALPDLTAHAYALSSIVAGGVMQASFYYDNLAPTSSGPFDVGLYLSRDLAVDGQDVFLREVSVSGVKGYGSYGGGEVGVGIPGSVATGSWYLLAMADPDDLVPELNETNNVKQGWAIEITPPACAPDEYEDDDFPTQARPLPLDTPQYRNHCDDQRDWAVVTVNEGDELAVRLDQSNGSGFDVDVYAEDGTLLATHWNAVFWRADRSGPVFVCAGCQDAASWFTPASYRLTAGLCPPDVNEPDDALASAREIVPGSSVTLNQCEGSADWLFFQAVGGARYSVDVAVANEATRPFPRFVDSTGSTLPTSANGTLTASADGSVWIEVRKPQTAWLLESEYTLSLTSR